MLIRESSRSRFEGPPGIEDRHLQLAVCVARRGFWTLDWHHITSSIATESRAQKTLIATVNNTTAISTPTATDVLATSQVPGRMLLLTMSWLKGGSKGQNIPKKRDITTSGSTTVGEEVSNALAVIPLQRNGIMGLTDMEKEPDGPRARGDLPHTPPSTARTLMDVPPLAIEAHSPVEPQQPATGKQYDDPAEYILKEDDLDIGTVNDPLGNKISDPVSRPHGKKKGAKLRLAALNILKMKSSSFLRKPQDGDEQQVVSRRRDSVEPLSSSGDRMALTRSNTGAGPASGSTPLRRARLTKPPPADLLRQRRSTVVESIQEDNVDPLEPRPPGWGTVAIRPSSSQSSHPGGVTRGDDITSLSQDPGVVTGGNVPGGLYPRPSSLKRNWSDGPQGKREATNQMGGPAGSPPRAATEGSDRPRPFSFAGMLDQYGSMKITEAATLESRVRDLENQLATLQTFVTTHIPSTQLERRSSQKSSHLSHKSSRLTDKSAQTSPALGPPFAEEMALSKRPDTAQSDVTTSTFMHGHDSEYSIAPESSTNGAPSKASGSVDWRAIARGVPLTPNKTPYGDSSVSSYMSDETINIRHRPYGNLDSAPGPSTDASKRSTVYSMETITPRNQGRDYDMDYHRERIVQTPVVALSEYNGVLKQLRREYRARKKLEAQMQTLQEQMNHVLHRQLLQSDPIYNIGRSPTITGRSLATTSAASTQRPEPVMNGRRMSSEVPTPDQTPPRGRSDLAHLFPNFDGNASATDDMDDDGGSYYIGGDDDGSENWQTPAEDTRSLLQIGGHLAPPLPLGPQKRTMSISQITEKASLASARAAANR